MLKYLANFVNLANQIKTLATSEAEIAKSSTEFCLPEIWIKASQNIQADVLCLYFEIWDRSAKSTEISE